MGVLNSLIYVLQWFHLLIYFVLIFEKLERTHQMEKNTCADPDPKIFNNEASLLLLWREPAKQHTPL